MQSMVTKNVREIVRSGVLPMMITVDATYENGVLKPLEPLPFSEQQRVRITVGPPTSRARQTAGIMGWTGSAELAERFAMDPELDYPPPLDSP
jgi:predicted DNA-binding antitoxin AbrB/MazE fold protein